MKMRNLLPFSAVTVACLTPLSADVVTEWNQEILDVIRSNSVNPPMASRAMAILHVSIYDAVNGADRQNVGFHVTSNTSAPSSAEAAAIGAAYEVMSSLFPSMSSHFADVRDNQLTSLGGGASVTNGLNWGTSVADSVITWRSTDGAAEAASTPYTPTGLPGDWSPTAPAYAAPLLPGFGQVTPWAMSSSDQFRPAGPPDLSSADWATDYNQVKSLGAAVGSTRTSDQTEIAHFWADGASTYTPPGHWNAIAQGFTDGMDVHETARLFAMLNTALADAAIVAWDAKFTYDLWRPITAIQNGDLDGNAATIQDPTWTPLVTTPPFPEYVSGHSTFSGAAATILGGLLGDNLAFSTEGDTNYDGIYDTTRSFTSFSSAAEEAGMSRIFGGIHYMSANEDGLASGASAANLVLSTYFQAIPEPSAAALLAIAGGLLTLTRRRSA